MITDLFTKPADSTQRLDAILHAFNDLLFILDSDGTILDYKAGDPSHLYTAPENILGRKMQNILPPKQAESSKMF